MSIVRGCPTSASRAYPKVRSAARFANRIVLLSSIVTIASVAVSATVR